MPGQGMPGQGLPVQGIPGHGMPSQGYGQMPGSAGGYGRGQATQIGGWNQGPTSSKLRQRIPGLPRAREPDFCNDESAVPPQVQQSLTAWRRGGEGPPGSKLNVTLIN